MSLLTGKASSPIGRYINRISLALNQLLSTLLGGAIDETISARVGRTRRHHPILNFCSKIFSDEHYIEAIENSRRDTHTARVYRPTTFITRRAALQVLAMTTPDQPSELGITPTRTINLDRDIRVVRGDKVMVIDADALWHALEAAQKIPLK